MIDPVTPAVQVPWRGKTYSLQYTLGALAEASGLPGIPPILEGGLDSVWNKPAYFKAGVLLFALVHRAFPDATLAECLDAVTGTKAKYYEEIITRACADLVPAIAKLLGVEVEGEPAPPLAGSSSGAVSGPALVSTSESPAKSSGRSRRGS